QAEPKEQYRHTIDSYAKWETNGHTCQIIKHFRPGDDQILIERGTRVFIDSEEIADLEKALHNLKICNKFYECVGWREGYDKMHEYPGPPLPKGKPRPKHCYSSMWKEWKF